MKAENYHLFLFFENRLREFYFYILISLFPFRCGDLDREHVHLLEVLRRDPDPRGETEDEEVTRGTVIADIGIVTTTEDLLEDGTGTTETGTGRGDGQLLDPEVRQPRILPPSR